MLRSTTFQQGFLGGHKGNELVMPLIYVRSIIIIYIMMPTIRSVRSGVVGKVTTYIQIPNI